MFEQEIARKPKINLTPLIDIIFLLVVFFMLSTSFVKIEALNMFVAKEEQEQTSPNLSVAQKAVQKFNSLETKLQIDLSVISINGRVVSKASLLTELSQQLGDSSQNGKVKILVGEGVDVQTLVEIIDITQAAKASDVEIVNSQ